MADFSSLLQQNDLQQQGNLFSQIESQKAKEAGQAKLAELTNQYNADKKSFNPINAILSGGTAFLTSGGNPFAGVLGAATSTRGKAVNPISSAVSGLGSASIGAQVAPDKDFFGAIKTLLKKENLPTTSLIMQGIQDPEKLPQVVGQIAKLNPTNAANEMSIKIGKTQTVKDIDAAEKELLATKGFTPEQRKDLTKQINDRRKEQRAEESKQRQRQSHLNMNKDFSPNDMRSFYDQAVKYGLEGDAAAQEAFAAAKRLKPDTKWGTGNINKIPPKPLKEPTPRAASIFEFFPNLFKKLTGQSTALEFETPEEAQAANLAPGTEFFVKSLGKKFRVK